MPMQGKTKLGRCYKESKGMLVNESFLRTFMQWYSREIGIVGSWLLKPYSDIHELSI